MAVRMVLHLDNWMAMRKVEYWEDPLVHGKVVVTAVRLVELKALKTAAGLAAG